MPRASLLLGLLLLATALPGCPAPAEPPKEPVCTGEKPCQGGLVCSLAAKPEDNACVPCKRDRECARNEFCHPLDRRCRLKPCYGNECKVHDDCTLGQFCVQGLCLNPSETSAAGCAVVSCADGESCNEGQRCNASTWVCEEDLGCTADDECAAGERCNVAAGRCEAACTPETAAEICGVKKVCAQGRCVECVQDTDCGGGLQCNLQTNVCESLTSCLSNRDCEVPLVCNRRTKECTVDPGPCLSAEDCLSEETCHLSTGKCVPAACLADRFEPNNSLAEAKSILLGSSPNLTVCAGDVDVYKVGLARGDRLQVVVDVDPLLNFEVAILDATGEPLAQGALAVDATVSAAGDYYVRARSRDAYVRYGLRLTLSRGTPCDADPEEPNDDYVHAAQLPAGDTYGRSLCPGDLDWYQVAVSRGQTVSVELTSSPLDGDLDLYLYDSDGLTQLGKSATAAEVESVSTSSFSGNRVFVKVVGNTNGVQNRYDLHVALRGP